MVYRGILQILLDGLRFKESVHVAWLTILWHLQLSFGLLDSWQQLINAVNTNAGIRGILEALAPAHSDAASACHLVPDSTTPVFP
ncbi:hypothetical protein SORBI_3001G236950 [Sorghum bicolor]|uniref:Uncharacterized protein n=1 Tax=Sorghum bicolor TaxID=4558 RepID=A0A1Z5S7L2_SORBI|nr:hypothetical protein SORBI_3001G236950 [Sorghum bicolor]